MLAGADQDGGLRLERTLENGRGVSQRIRVRIGRDRIVETQGTDGLIGQSDDPLGHVGIAGRRRQQHEQRPDHGPTPTQRLEGSADATKQITGGGERHPIPEPGAIRAEHVRHELPEERLEADRLELERDSFFRRHGPTPTHPLRLEGGGISTCPPGGTYTHCRCLALGGGMTTCPEGW